MTERGWVVHAHGGHWFDHMPSMTPHVKTAGEVLAGDLPREPDGTQRYIHICGGCQHWISAAHSGHFDGVEPPYDKHAGGGGFTQSLMEALCPECGHANFRHTSLVLAHCDAAAARNEGADLTRWLSNKIDLSFWSGGIGPITQTATEDVLMREIESYQARCPCCGCPVEHGSREFDFHHWDYENDSGCMLCRKCHSHIHRDLTAAEQARENGGWKSDSAARLYERALEFGLRFDTPREFMVRFNIQSESTLSDIVGLCGGDDNAR